MTEVSDNNFGLLIAYVIPGFVVVAAASGYSTTVQSWLGVGANEPASIGGFLYGTLASVAAGVTVSAVRWLVIDPIHHVTGVPRPHWDFALFRDNHAAVEVLVRHHYRYYQFYSNMVAATVMAAILPRALLTVLPDHPIVVGLAVAGLVGLFFVASRDALKKYYDRTSSVLGERRGGDSKRYRGC